MTEWRRGPFRRPRSKRCPETDALAPPQQLPVRSARAISRGHASSRAHRVRVQNNGQPRATASVGNSSRCGIQWDSMGFYGQFVGNAGFLRLITGREQSSFTGCSGSLGLWISLCFSESERITSARGWQARQALPQDCWRPIRQDGWHPASPHPQRRSRVPCRSCNPLRAGPN